MKILAALFALTLFALADAPTLDLTAGSPVVDGSKTVGTYVETGDLPTKVVFNYGLKSEATFTRNVTKRLPASPSNPQISATFSNLAPGLYHYNVVATNDDAPAGVLKDGTDFLVEPYKPTIGQLAPTTNRAAGTATLRATVRPNGAPVTGISFDYGLTTSFGTTVPGTPATIADGSGPVTTTTASLSNLVAGKQYYYRVRATADPAGEATSPTYAFNTSVSGATFDPVIDGVTQIKVTVDTANLSTNLAFTYGIVGGTQKTSSLVVPATTTPTQQPLSLAALVGGQTYHFSASVQNDATTGAIIADGVDFLVPAYAPTVIRSAHEVTGNGTATIKATLKATVTPNGSPVSTIKFDYGTSASYGTTVLGTPSKIDDADATTGTESTVSVSGLLRGQIYHYKVTATNGLGTTATQDATFATAANHSPIAREDKVFLQGDAPIFISVLKNDSDPDDGDTLTLVSATQGKQGHTEIVGNTVKYTPLPDSTGSDTFTYLVRDSYTQSVKTATGKVTITAPSLAARGSKAAEIKNKDGEVVGLIRLVGSAEGQITGKVQIGTEVYVVNGTIDANGRFNYTIPRNGDVPLQLTAEFSDPTKSFSATLEGGEDLYQAEAPAYAITDKRRDEIVGEYTVQLPPGSDSDGSPQGTGFARIRVLPWGDVTIKGQFGDGTKFSTRGVLGGTDSTAGVSMWVTPNDSRVSAQFTFGTGTSPTVSGEMKWYRSPNDDSNLFPDGFYTTLSPTGARYVPPEDGQRALDTRESKATITLSDGNLGSNITHNLEISKSDRITILNDTGDEFSLKINRKDGTFKGYFEHPYDGSQKKFEGVLVQSQGQGSGVFTGVDQTGSVILKLGQTNTPTTPTVPTTPTTPTTPTIPGGIDLGDIDTGDLDLNDINNNLQNRQR